MPLQINGFDFKTATERVYAALDKVGLLKNAKSRPITLSGSERQRLCVARAVVGRPSILIADEPTANLDTDYANDIINIFKSLHQVGITVLIATHNTELLGNAQQRILALSHGELTL